MNGERFYDLFKDALVTLGLDWGEKHKMEVELGDEKITFSAAHDDGISVVMVYNQMTDTSK